MLARLQGTMGAALNSNIKAGGLLPKYFIIVLDDDLITFLDFKEEGTATLLGSWIEWLSAKYEEMIKKQLRKLPEKGKKKHPFLYWVAAPTHNYFSKERNDLRIKFNLSLESVIRGKNNMRIIKLKNVWETKNSKLVINDRMTEFGLTTYWRAIDASFKFNEVRREKFAARQIAESATTITVRSNLEPTNRGRTHTTSQRDARLEQAMQHSRSPARFDSTQSYTSIRCIRSPSGYDPLPEFFRRHGACHGDHHMGDHEEYRQDRRRREPQQKFILPRPCRCHQR